MFNIIINKFKGIPNKNSIYFYHVIKQNNFFFNLYRLFILYLICLLIIFKNINFIIYRPNNRYF